MHAFILSPSFSVATYIYTVISSAKKLIIIYHRPASVTVPSTHSSVIYAHSLQQTKKLLKRKAKAEPRHQKTKNKPLFVVHCISCSLLLLFLSISPSPQSPGWFQHTSGMGLSIRHYQKTTTK